MIKCRNMWMQVLLVVVTLGLYIPYWFYQTSKEMKSIARDESAHPVLWTILMFIPIVHFYPVYKYSELFERVSAEKLNRWILFLLWLFVNPAVWFIVQTDLNEKAGGGSWPLREGPAS